MKPLLRDGARPPTDLKVGGRVALVIAFNLLAMALPGRAGEDAAVPLPADVRTVWDLARPGSSGEAVRQAARGPGWLGVRMRRRTAIDPARSPSMTQTTPN